MAQSTDSSADLDRLQHKIGYRFKQLALLKQALTHKSYSKTNNERLEFMGDAVLGYLVVMCSSALPKRTRGRAVADASPTRAREDPSSSGVSDRSSCLLLGLKLHQAVVSVVIWPMPWRR